MTVTIDKARQNLDELVATVSRTHKRVKLRGKTHSVYLVSQAEIDGIAATAELRAIPGMVESLLKSRATPVEECLPEEKFDWNAL